MPDTAQGRRPLPLPRTARSVSAPQPAAYAAKKATLSSESTRWLAELPANVRPAELAVRLPHIVNRLAAFWPTPERCSLYFDELLRDRRGGRKGFPARIALELATLKKHHESLLRRSLQNSWNDAFVR